jgi:hypothetical protein
MVRLSDGAMGAAIRWYGDEVLFPQCDLIGDTPEQLRSAHFRRDRYCLRS